MSSSKNRNGDRQGRLDKLMVAWGVLGTLGMLAASAVLASPAARPAAASRIERMARPAVAPAPARDARLEQFVADAQALWPELSPEVREMVLELVRSRGQQVDLVGLDLGGDPDLATTLATERAALADVGKLQGRQAIVSN
ncbi:hypothetical protein [Leptothrix discophora]|uniref:Uncharacterized protein n=1 Tax=Leptothrix discophora TaxID=89 RepID=A0ABT9G5I6_LEPDI|nr:hypothetical protein [Leptothrix discophora]MDP4301749.1 hypothetical protein [Leptothrix discophora]